MKTFVSVLALAAIVATGPASLSPVDAAEPQPRPGGTLTWGVTTEPSCFDPHRSSQQAAFFVARNYIDSMVGKRADGTFAPWLATAWTISPDGTVYTFTLRDDVVFHDGERFDAAAVKANFDVVKNPANAANAVALLEHFSAAEVVSPHVVRLALARPDSTFLESVSNVKLGLISPKSLAKGDLCGGGPALAGTGPFVFERDVRGQSARFARTAPVNTPISSPGGCASAP